MYKRVPTTRSDSGSGSRSPGVRKNINRRVSNRYAVDVKRGGTSVRPRSSSTRPRVTTRPPTRTPRTGGKPRVGGDRGSRGSGVGTRPRNRSGSITNRPRRAVRRYASHRYNYGNGHGYGGHHHAYHHLLGLGFLGHLGWSHWHHYAYDPFYCNYYLGYGYHHYHWSYNYCHPLNYGNWWYPSSYRLPSYIYVNSVGDYSPYPSTVVIASGDPVDELAPLPAKPATKPTTETLIKRYVTLGDFYFKEGRYTESSESYLRALAYAPEDGSIHFSLADALFALGDYHYAAFVIGKALRLDPAMAFAEADKRTFYADKKEFEKHMATILSYVREKPHDPAGHLVLGYNYKFSDQKDKAIAAFREVLKLEPKHEAATLFLDALLPPPAEKKDSGKSKRTPEKKDAKTSKKSSEKTEKLDR